MEREKSFVFILDTLHVENVKIQHYQELSRVKNYILQGVMQRGDWALKTQLLKCFQALNNWTRNRNRMIKVAEKRPGYKQKCRFLQRAAENHNSRKKGANTKFLEEVHEK